jgi:hypothetical protein
MSSSLSPLRRPIARALVLVTLAVVSLVGCGKVPGAAVSELSAIESAVVDGHTLVKFGFDGAGGESPALLHTRDGWLAVYVGLHVGKRHVTWTTSTDGVHWAAPKGLGTSDFSDQAPVLVNDGAGVCHLYFASNRDGNDFQVFHTRFANGSFAAPTAINGTTSVAAMAVTYANNRFILAAETVGLGLAVSESPDGEQFSNAKVVTEAGFTPALATLPDGKQLLAYMHDGKIYTRTGTPGAWSAEALGASGADKLREPTLVWAQNQGWLAYSERTTDGYKLRAKRFDQQAKFDPAPVSLPDAGGESRAPNLACDAQGTVALVWGMKYSNGQQGVIFSSQIP